MQKDYIPYDCIYWNVQDTQMYRDGKQISGTWGWVREWGQTVIERGEVFGNGNVQKLDCG